MSKNRKSIQALSIREKQNTVRHQIESKDRTVFCYTRPDVRIRPQGIGWAVVVECDGTRQTFWGETLPKVEIREGYDYPYWVGITFAPAEVICLTSIVETTVKTIKY